MNDNKKPIIAKRKSRNALSWFSIQRYSWTQTLLSTDPVLLYQEFRLRVEAYEDPELRERMLAVIQKGDGRLTTYAAPAPSIISDSVASTVELDASLLAGNSHPFLFATPAVSAMTCRDVAIISEQAAPDAIPAQGEYSEPGRAKEQVGGPFSGKSQVMYIRDKLSIDSHRYSREPDAGEAEYAMHCKIDLDYTDAAILESLKLALPLWRKSLNQLTGHAPLSQKQGDVALAKIVSYRLIPAMDIELWEKSQNGSRLSQIEVMRLLDLKHLNSDDQYRKTIKPYLKKLMSQDWLRKLYAAAYSRQMGKTND